MKKGADSKERDRREALGRSRGGYGTKACVIADGRGRAVAFALAPGQAHELPMAPGLLDGLPDAPVACPDWVYANRHLVENLWAHLKEWRAVAARYEKTARSFLSILSRAATCDWLRS